jgi:ABC-type multidrug transport system fused ATPase/permease subunit
MSKKNKEAQFSWSSYRRIWRTFGRHLLPYWRKLAIALVGMILATLVDLARPWPLKLVFDYVLLRQPLPEQASWLQMFGSDPIDLLLPIVSMIVLIVVLQSTFSYLNKYLVSIVGESVVIDIRERIFMHLQALSMQFHKTSRSGDLVLRLTSDITHLKKLFVDSVQDFGRHFLKLAGVVAAMLWMDWRLCLVAVAILPILYLLTQFFSTSVKQLKREERKRESNVASIVQENMLSISLIQAYAAEADEQERFQKQSRKSLDAQIRTAGVAKRFRRLVQTLIAVGTAAVIYVGARRVLGGDLTPGDLIVFHQYLRELYRPIDKFSGMVVNLAQHLVSGERLIELVEQPIVIRDSPDAVDAGRFLGAVEFRNVSFQYKEDAEVLRDVSIKVDAGQTVALVGSSGAGKSTMANLLMRFYDPAEGQVLIDGTDIRRYTLSSLREQITVLLQDTFLFRKSIRDNIAYARPDASDDEVAAAAQAAQAHDFIMALPQGYESLVEEGGVNLSGGQKQRISIARAILRDAPILILDEPTTGLDALAEAQINEALRQLTEARTTFVIAHRFSTLANAKQILVLEHGRIMQQGTHAQLLEQSESYRTLWELQFGAKRLEDQVG